jgi:hypothetical protein
MAGCTHFNVSSNRNEIVIHDDGKSLHLYYNGVKEAIAINYSSFGSTHFNDTTILNKLRIGAIQLKHFISSMSDNNWHKYLFDKSSIEFKKVNLNNIDEEYTINKTFFWEVEKSYVINDTENIKSIRIVLFIYSSGCTSHIFDLQIIDDEYFRIRYIGAVL